MGRTTHYVGDGCVPTHSEIPKGVSSIRELLNLATKGPWVRVGRQGVAAQDGTTVCVVDSGGHLWRNKEAEVDANTSLIALTQEVAEDLCQALDLFEEYFAELNPGANLDPWERRASTLLLKRGRK